MHLETASVLFTDTVMLAESRKGSRHKMTLIHCEMKRSEIKDRDVAS
jgi:hypothetical protein